MTHITTHFFSQNHQDDEDKEWQIYLEGIRNDGNSQFPSPDDDDEESETADSPSFDYHAVRLVYEFNIFYI